MPTATGVWDLEEAKNHTVCETLAKNLTKFLPLGVFVWDLGCGNGGYAKIMEDEGFNVRAVEGTKGAREIALCSEIIEADLSQPLSGPKGSVVCLEVGEHIPLEYEEQFMDNLNNLCDRRLILSWAIPDQGGYHHVNERTNIYIIERMARYGLFINHRDTRRLRKGIEDEYWWFRNSLMVFDRSPKIGLAMIVKDEEKTIERALKSAMPFIDCAVINYSGTTDDTVEVGERLLIGAEREWINPEWKGAADAYNHCIRRLEEMGAHWILRLDADQIVRGEMPDFGAFSECEALSIPIINADNSFCGVRPFLFKPTAKYRGVRHEGLYAFPINVINDLEIFHYDDSGARPRDNSTYLNDYEAMSEQYGSEGNDDLVRRYTFYMAQSLKDGERPDKALNWYRARTLMGGYVEEVAISYKEIAYILNTLEAWIIALQRASHRPDVAFGALKFALSQTVENQGLILDQIDSSRWETQLMFQDDSFHWKALDMLAIIHYRIGEKEAARKIWNGLTTWTEIPTEDLDRIRVSLTESL